MTGRFEMKILCFSEKKAGGIMKSFLQEITDFIFLQDEPRKADVIFLPGSNEGELARTAAGLYHRGFAPLIIPSGKYAKLCDDNR